MNFWHQNFSIRILPPCVLKIRSKNFVRCLIVFGLAIYQLMLGSEICLPPMPPEEKLLIDFYFLIASYLWTWGEPYYVNDQSCPVNVPAKSFGIVTYVLLIIFYEVNILNDDKITVPAVIFHHPQLSYDSNVSICGTILIWLHDCAKKYIQYLRSWKMC